MIYLANFLKLYYRMQIFMYSNCFNKAYDLQVYINQKITVTAEAVRYFIEKNPSKFLKNYKKLIANPNPTEYHNILPFHEDGTSKEKIDYMDYFDDQNVVIKHFSFYLNKCDNYEFSHQISQIIPCNENAIEHKKFTIVYLIVLSSTNTNIIREIKSLEYNSNNEICFLLFIDNKSNRTSIYNLFNTSKKDEFKNVFFVDSPRFHVGWSKITLTLSEAVLMMAAIKYFGQSLYLSLHSESDYPLVPNKLIVDYLKRNYPNNYIAINKLDKLEKWKLDRPNVFHISNKIKNYKKYIKMIHFLFPNRKFPQIIWQFGSNWFTITVKDSIKLMNELKRNRFYIDFLEYSFISDENFFQTLAVMTNISTTNCNHRYIDWSTDDGHPRIFDAENFQKIIQNRCNFWARKFSPKKTDIMDMIDKNIRKMEKIYNYSYEICK